MNEKPKKDRDYYRMLTDQELIDEVKYAVEPDWKELAFALAESLRDHIRPESAWRDEAE